MQLQIIQTRYPQSVSDGQPDDKAVLRPALVSIPLMYLLLEFLRIVGVVYRDQ
jgi:hypothetical protein